MRFITIALCGAWLAGCDSHECGLAGRLGSHFVGQNVDALVAEFGPLANTFKMNSGETS